MPRETRCLVLRVTVGIHVYVELSFQSFGASYMNSDLVFRVSYPIPPRLQCVSYMIALRRGRS